MIRKHSYLLLGSLFVSNPVIAAEFKDPSYYTRKASWQETIRVSREALIEPEREQVSPTNFKPFASEILRGGDLARHVAVSVSGQEDLFLMVNGAPDSVWGAATWADAKLIAKDGTETFVCHLKDLKVLEGRHDIDKNLEAGVSGPLRISGREFEHGIHVYANSKIRIPLDGNFERFEGWIGVDDWVGKHGAVRFRITGKKGAAQHDLWNLAARDFAEETPRRQMKWERQDRILERDWAAGDFAALAQRYADACFRVAPLQDLAKLIALSVNDAKSLQAVRNTYYRSRMIDETLENARTAQFNALRLAISDLIDTFGTDYQGGQDNLAQLTHLEKSVGRALSAAEKSGELGDCEQVIRLMSDFQKLERKALLSNPLLDFDRLLVIKRKPDGDPRRSAGRGYGVGEYLGLPRQSSKCNPNIERPIGWENEIATLSPLRPDGTLTTLYQPSGQELINDVDLHFDADRMIFSMPDANGFWRLWEIDADGKGLRQLPENSEPDVHYYDACYLPNGEIALVSTAVFQGVPCNAGVIVGMMYRMDENGRHVRQIAFEQDHDYCPTVLNDGRILYLRWDYTDTPHVWNRMLFSMRPDGTGQAEYYGNNSYWPNSIFYARPIPNHPSKIAGIVTGHHVGRAGDLVIFDPALGKHEADGVVQRIPGRGQKVEPVIEDKLTEHSWPKFLHPYPLNENYYLVSCKPTPDSLWGIYLADVFDNITLVREEEQYVLLEPVPFRKTTTPPVIPSRVRPDQDDALIHLVDVHRGPGMKDVPRGTVKNLRVFAYHFSYQRIAGIDHRVGTDGPWDVKRVLGTVPVREDGSVFFRVPAKTPISVQPLDANGRAVQLMRSWMTAMPGETLSCVGCHDQQTSATPPNRHSLALQHPPAEIQPWHGPVRGFSFKREVQPVLDKYCVGCHNGQRREDGNAIPDLRGEQETLVVYRNGDPEARIMRDTPREELVGRYGAIFEPSYLALRRLVRVGGLESDLHLLNPMEFHANTSELVQMLEKGHHNVKLDDEAWDRLITWIDLNAPCHGTWNEFTRITGNQLDRRTVLQKLYGGILENAETIPEIDSQPIQPIMPDPLPKVSDAPVECANWPFDGVEAKRRQVAEGPVTRSIDLGAGVMVELVRIPAGSFIMGDPEGEPDEKPMTSVNIDRSFWMSKFEVTNEQYARFDAEHDSRFEHRSSWIFSEDYLGWPVNSAQQPVVRVSWERAMAFCRWISQKIGEEITLPTEAQWEYACRAGAATPLSYGDLNTDFSNSANLADYTIRDLAYQGWRPKPPDLVARDPRSNDRALVTVDVGSYQPNPWGLHDMHGNAAEWTRTNYQPYPYRADGRDEVAEKGKKVVRGGSWYDRPKRSRSAFRLSYPSFQQVYNVGFRIVLETDPTTKDLAKIGIRSVDHSK